MKCDEDDFIKNIFKAWIATASNSTSRIIFGYFQTHNESKTVNGDYWMRSPTKEHFHIRMFKNLTSYVR